MENEAELKRKVESVANCFKQIVDKIEEFGEFNRAEISQFGFSCLAKIAYDENGYDRFMLMLDCCVKLADRDEAAKVISLNKPTH